MACFIKGYRDAILNDRDVPIPHANINFIQKGNGYV
jgi:hypothetical protein